jgi:hypothetical protein
LFPRGRVQTFGLAAFHHSLTHPWSHLAKARSALTLTVLALAERL